MIRGYDSGRSHLLPFEATQHTKKRQTHVCMCVCVYVCVCVHVCMYVCMYVCMFVCMYVCLYVCMSVRLYVCMCVCVYVCIYVCVYVCMYVCMSVCLYVCMYVCVYVFMCVCVYVCMCVCVYVCMHVCMYVCLYVCMCIYMCIYIEQLRTYCCNDWSYPSFRTSLAHGSHSAESIGTSRRFVVPSLEPRSWHPLRFAKSKGCDSRSVANRSNPNREPTLLTASCSINQRKNWRFKPEVIDWVTPAG